MLRDPCKGDGAVDKVMTLWKETAWAGEKRGGRGEAYLFSVLPERPSLLEDGRLLRDVTGQEMPLIKYIDAEGALSVQVHPAANGETPGKDEVWFIDEIYDGGEVRIGFRRDVTPLEVKRSCQDGTVLSLMEKISVAPGDVLLIPGGTIHAAKGISFWEVQRSLDVTYRLFDYGRGRELQLAAGLSALQCQRQPLRRSTRQELERSFFRDLPFFVLPRSLNGFSSRRMPLPFAVVVTEGQGRWDGGSFGKNDCFWVREGERNRWRGKGNFFLIFPKISGNH